MGYSLSWVAVRGKSPEELRAQVGLQATAEREEVPESPLVGAGLDGGWSLLLANNDERFISETLLATISGGCDAVACFVDEHVGVSGASGWKDGKCVWSVEHDAEQGLDHLAIDGSPPDSLAAIRRELEAEHREQKLEADYLFDAPVVLAQRLTGFRHDEAPPTSEREPFEVLTARLRR